MMEHASPMKPLNPPPPAIDKVDLSIIIPCFNEEATIRNTAQAVLGYMARYYPAHSLELVLINDGSSDGTLLILQTLAESNPAIRLVSFKFNQGRGAAIKAGIAASQGSRVILLDADLSYDIDHVGEILHCFEQSPRTDVVVISAYMPGGVVKGVPFSRLLISRMANWILSGFFSANLSTVTCVVRGYRGDMIRNLPLFEDGKQLHLEILRKMALSGAVIQEIPGRLVWKQKKHERRKNNLNVAGSAKQHLLYGMLVKPTRIFKYIGLLLCLVGLYEASTIVYNVFLLYHPQANILYDLSTAIKASYFRSPHTFILAGIALMLGFQTFSALTILEISRMQHEESLRHQLEILVRLKKN
jgi:dolichol-phosphate mannosyltransferase